MWKLIAVADKFLPLIYFRENLKKLQKYDIQITYLDWHSDLDAGEFANKLRNIEDNGPEAEEPPPKLEKEIIDAEILIVGFSPVPKRILNAGKKLKIVCCSRTALKNIDVKAAANRKILVVNAPGRAANAVADLTFGLLIAESRNIVRGHTALKSGVWTKNFPNSSYLTSLPGKTLGIIGFGNIGQKVQQRAKGFEMKTLIYDPFIPEEEIKKAGGKPIALKKLLKKSDFVTIHVPLKSETKKLIGEDEINLMKPTAYLINTSRGENVDEKALIKALKERRILGAALDVYEKEPPPEGSPLLSLDNVTLTPHMGGYTVDSRAEGIRIVVDEVEKFLNRKII